MSKIRAKVSIAFNSVSVTGNLDKSSFSVVGRKETKVKSVEMSIEEMEVTPQTTLLRLALRKSREIEKFLEDDMGSRECFFTFVLKNGK